MWRKNVGSGWPRFGSVRLRFGDGTVRAVPVFGSGGSSKEGVFVCLSTVFLREGRFRFRFRFLANSSGGSGSAFGSWENGSDGRIPGVMGPKTWKRIGKFVLEKAKFCVKSRILGAIQAKSVETCKVSKIASLEDISWEKRLHKCIAFWTTHEITYLNSEQFIRRRKNYIGRFLFSERNFEYVKN